MKIKTISISRKFNLGNYETQDITIEVEVENEISTEDITTEAFNHFRTVVGNSNLPTKIKETFFNKESC